MQVRSSVRLMPQNQPSGRGLLPSPTAWSPDQHPVAMLADVSRRILGRTEGRGLGFGQLVRTHKGKCLKCQSSSDGHSDYSALCAGGLLGPLQSPNWVKVCLISTVVFLPVFQRNKPTGRWSICRLVKLTRVPFLCLPLSLVGVLGALLLMLYLLLVVVGVVFCCC